MIVCDKCKKEEKNLTKYIIPEVKGTDWEATSPNRKQVLLTFTHYDIFPTEIELCKECATEVARKIWN